MPGILRTLPCAWYFKESTLCLLFQEIYPVPALSKPLEFGSKKKGTSQYPLHMHIILYTL